MLLAIIINMLILNWLQIETITGTRYCDSFHKNLVLCKLKPQAVNLRLNDFATTEPLCISHFTIAVLCFPLV